jgi:single-strand DNA-binding protein
MASLNKVFLAGNLTRSPELRYTPGGTAVAQFGLAVNRRYKNREGQMQEEVTFVDIEVWGRQAEAASEYISKGSPVLLEGRLKLDTWESKQTGERRSKLRVVGERVQFLASRKDRGGQSGREGRPSRDRGAERKGERTESRPKDARDERPSGTKGGVDDLPPDGDIPF